jgi:phosphonate transport system substrate-binding protein
MRLLCLLALLLCLSSCFKPESASQPLGSEKNPIVMAFVPSTEAEKVVESGSQLAALMQERTGLHYKPYVATSYVGIVEAMGAGTVHVGWLPPMAYVFAHQRNGDKAVLKVVRNGKATYRGEIVVMADSGIADIAGLKGKRMAFTEQSSASGHLYPRALLLENGVDPERDLGEVMYSGSHDAAITALVKGSADAACCYDDARTKLVDAGLADVMTTTKVLAYTPEIPADNVTVIEGFDPALEQKVVEGLLSLTSDEKGKAVLMEMYEIEGLQPATDADYEPVRQMAQLLELDVEEEAKKGE